MARSYGSYSRQRQADKPYRGAELALGFLGQMLESKNRQALEYEKLAQREEEQTALAGHREGVLGSKTVTLPDGSVMQYNPGTNLYDVEVSGSGGQKVNWGEELGNEFWDKYISLEWEDTNNSGVLGDKGDRPWGGPAAELFRTYTSAKKKQTTGWEDLHPQKIIDGLKAYDGPDPAKQAEITNFFEELGVHQKKMDDYKQLVDLGKTATAGEARALFHIIDDRYKKKPLNYQSRASIQTLLNDRERMMADLRGAKVRSVYSGDGVWETADTSDLTIKSQTHTVVELNDEQRTEHENKIALIEQALSKFGVTFLPYGFVPGVPGDPANKAPWVVR